MCLFSIFCFSVFVLFLLFTAVKAIGFDYDYTLTTYKPRMIASFYNLAAQYLTRELNYPTEVSDMKYDPTFAIRGLGVDRRHGVLLKLNQRLQVSRDCALFGRTPVPKETLVKLYGSQFTLTRADRDKYVGQMVG